MIDRGMRVEIRPAYSMDTGRRDHFDEFASCEAVVVRDSGLGDVLVDIKAKGEAWIARSRLKLLAFALVALAGCAEGEPLPVEAAPLPEHTFVQPLNAEVLAPPELSRAMQVIRAEWVARLGELPPIEQVAVRWFDVELEGRGLLYPDRQPHHLIGVFFRGPETDEIHLLDQGRDSYCDTPLVHEMLHWALFHATGDAEGGHDGPLWDAEVMHEVCRSVRGAGL